MQACAHKSVCLAGQDFLRSCVAQFCRPGSPTSEDSDRAGDECHRIGAPSPARVSKTLARAVDQLRSFIAGAFQNYERRLPGPFVICNRGVPFTVPTGRTPGRLKKPESTNLLPSRRQMFDFPRIDVQSTNTRSVRVAACRIKEPDDAPPRPHSCQSGDHAALKIGT